MRKWIVVMAWMAIACMNAQNVRETIRLDDGWKFAFGNAADPKKDFGCGTEYFNYLTKANSIHNEGPNLGKCRFTSCRHINDKGCEIVAAVESGEISESRHNSYIALYNEAKDIKEWENK